MRKRKPFNDLKPATRARYEREAKHLIAFAEAMDHQFHYPNLLDRTPTERDVRRKQDIIDHIRLARAARMIPNEMEYQTWSLEQRLLRELPFDRMSLRIERHGDF
jgi:hypothetical protein